MIENKKVAKEISDLMIHCSGEIDRTIAKIQRECSEEEFIAYRRAAGKVMGYIFIDIMSPLYVKYPDLKPEGLQ